MQLKDYMTSNNFKILKHIEAYWELFESDWRCFWRVDTKNFSQHWQTLHLKIALMTTLCLTNKFLLRKMRRKKKIPLTGSCKKCLICLDH